jgi:phenylpyruvate tautomerase PptA (4-oxalocrotonate tautomerase family)
MPLVKIEILEGKTSEYKKAVQDGVHNALVDAIGIPNTDNFQRLYEVPKENFVHPHDRTDKITFIEIILFPGRSESAKKRLYETVVKNLGQNPGINGNDILIVLQEPPMEDWSIRDGKPATEVDFNFKINV